LTDYYGQAIVIPMFPVNLIRHRDPELFFAVVEPVGVDMDSACTGLERVLSRFQYALYTTRVIEELKGVEGYLKNESEFYDERLENRMNEGDRFRRDTGRDEALVLLALDNVKRVRKSKDPESPTVPRQAYLFRSLKRLFSHEQRLAIFRRDQGICQVKFKCQDRKCEWDAWEADHAKPWSKGGKTIVANGQVACILCNSAKKDRESNSVAGRP